jgi:hypothetical protein
MILEIGFMFAYIIVWLVLLGQPMVSTWLLNLVVQGGILLFLFASVFMFPEFSASPTAENVYRIWPPLMTASISLWLLRGIIQFARVKKGNVPIFTFILINSLTMVGIFGMNIANAIEAAGPSILYDPNNYGYFSGLGSNIACCLVTIIPFCGFLLNIDFTWRTDKMISDDSYGGSERPIAPARYDYLGREISPTGQYNGDQLTDNEIHGARGHELPVYEQTTHASDNDRYGSIY